MTELEEIICQAIVDCVSDLVVERFIARQKSALVLFTGTPFGLRDACGSLLTLRENGWTLKPILSRTACELLPAEKICTICGEPLPAEEEVSTLLEECRLLLIPALSINTAAKAACCIGDSLPSCLIANALSKGKRIVAARDGCCPNNRERAQNGFSATAPYRAKLLANLNALESYGVELIPAKDLAAAAEGNAPKVQTSRLPEKQVFGRGDAAQYESGQILYLPRDVLVTPLAVDELRRRGVRLIQE